MTADQIAVLVMAYGGPGNLDEVEPYLMDVRGGRPTKPELVEEIRARYARIGGRSPILELTRAQAVGIGRALGDRFTVFVGMRHWHPYIQDAVNDIAAAARVSKTVASESIMQMRADGEAESCSVLKNKRPLDGWKSCHRDNRDK